MLKENTCFSKAISHAKVDLMCVPLSKIDREKKVQKSRTQFYEIVSEGIFLFLCTCVFTRLQKVSKNKVNFDKKNIEKKNLSYFVKISLVFVPFCQNRYTYFSIHFISTLQLYDNYD